MLTDVETELRKLHALFAQAGRPDEARTMELAAEIVRQSGKSTVALRDVREASEYAPADAGWKAKDGDDRTIPLTGRFLEFLRSYGLRDPYMLRPDKVKWKGVYRVELRYRLNQHLAQCGVLGVSFQDFRRTFASLLASRGVSIYKIARWMGDNVVIVQAHYGHLIPSDNDIERAWK